MASAPVRRLSKRKKAKKKPERKRVDVLSFSNIVKGVVKDAKYEGYDVIAVIEKVGPMPTDGCVAAFAFGEAVGGLNTVLELLGLKVLRITPQVWKKYYGLIREKGEAKRDFKKESIAKAKEYCGLSDVKADVAEAALLALYTFNNLEKLTNGEYFVSGS